MSRRLIPIDLAELTRLKALKFKLRELAKHFGVSVSTLKRRLKPGQAATNAKCAARWYRHGPLPSDVEHCCRWCGVLFAGHRQTTTCSQECREQYTANREFFIPLTKQMIRDHIEYYGLSVESCQRLGMTVSEVEELLNG
jgi:hypothetical protein